MLLVETAMAAQLAASNGSIIDPNQAYEIQDVIRVGISLLVLVSGFLCVIFVIWGGVMLILSGGKDEKVKPAVNSIRYAVMGIIIIILSIFVGPKIGDLLGLGVSKYISPASVFSTIQDISGKLFGSKTDLDLDSTSTSTDTLPADFSDL